MNWLTAATVFFAVAFADVAYAKYTIAVTLRQAAASAGWAAGIILLGGIGILGYTHDKRLLLFAAAGAYAGTYLTVKRHR